MQLFHTKKSLLLILLWMQREDWDVTLVTASPARWTLVFKILKGITLVFVMYIAWLELQEIHISGFAQQGEGKGQFPN